MHLPDGNFAEEPPAWPVHSNSENALERVLPNERDPSQMQKACPVGQAFCSFLSLC
jgi:hypothetical protein